jgi:hypothetical protein
MILSFASIMLVPIAWYVTTAFWQPRGWREKVRYLAGLCIYLTCGPILNLVVLFYALWNMDSFGWGKTRQVVEVVDDEKAIDAIHEEKTESSESSERGLPFSPERRPWRTTSQANLEIQTKENLQIPEASFRSNKQNI